jgi:hypothetical protein
VQSISRESSAVGQSSRRRIVSCSLGRGIAHELLVFAFEANGEIELGIEVLTVVVPVGERDLYAGLEAGVVGFD